MAESDTLCRRERKDAQRNLERVLRAAHELFAERGAEVTMEEVARRAGVGVGTIYRRFASKEQLFAAVSSAVCADARHLLRQAAADDLDPLGKIRALVVAQYRRGERLACLRDPWPDSADHQAGAAHADQQELYTALHAMLRQAIGEGQRAGLIRPGDPAVLAALCVELLSPRAFQNLRRLAGGSADDVAEHVIHFVLHGLLER